MECGALHKTNPYLPFPILEANLYDDCVPSLPIETNFIVDAPSTKLYYLRTNPYHFAPSRGVLTLVASPIHLPRQTS